MGDALVDSDWRRLHITAGVALVDNEDVDAEESLLETRELARIPRFQELAHQIGRPGEEHASFLLRGFDTQGNGQMRLPRPDRTGEDEILGRGDPLAPGQGMDLGRADALGGGEIKRVEGLDLGKARLAES